MRSVQIGNVEFSRIICGSNPFNARSHFSAARDAEYAARFTDEAVARVLRRAMGLGLNTYETSASERAWNVVTQVQSATGRTLHLVGSTRIDETSAMRRHEEKLRFLIDRKAALCVIHAQHVEKRWPGGDIPGLEQMLEAIHAAGLLAGVSAHRIATVELCERKRYPIDAYLFPLNITGFVYPGYDGGEPPGQRVDLIRSIPRPFITMKTLAAGRLPPSEGLQFVAESIKSSDLVSIGVGSVEELEETVAIAENTLG